MGTIVVGVDGSAQSSKALGWAVGEAGLRGSGLRVVYAYDYKPEWVEYAPMEGTITQAEMNQARERFERGAADAQKHAEGLLQSLVEPFADDGVPISTLAVQSRHAARTLVDQSEDADLLVVGSRGRGGFTGLMLGSVSQQTIHLARCPVVVIPPDR